MSRIALLYTDPRVTLGDITEALGRHMGADLYRDADELIVQPSDRPKGVRRWPFVRIFEGDAKHEPEEDLARVAIAAPRVFLLQFDSFRLLKEVILAVTDEFALWIAHDTMDPTPGAEVAERLRREPSWNLDHPSKLED